MNLYANNEEMEQAVGDIKTDNQNEETIGSGESWYDERNLVVSHQQEIQPSYCKFENDIASQWWREASSVSNVQLRHEEGPSNVSSYSLLDHIAEPQQSIILQTKEEILKKGVKIKGAKKIKSTKQAKDAIKRSKHPEKWKVNVKKNARLRGEEYIGVGGKVVPAKVMGPPCDCRMRCNEKIDEMSRQQLHGVFWKTCTWEQRKQYIALLVKESPKQRTRCRGEIKSENRRQVTFTYSLLINGDFITVCKSMFLSTFSVSEKFVRHAMDKKRSSPGGIIGPDQRGRHTPKSKKSEVVRDRVREHIKSFPTEKSLDPIDLSGVRYLDAGLSIAAMHKMYVIKCKEDGVPDAEIVKESYYREMFKAEFNLAFKPIKMKKNFDDKEEEFT